MDRNWNRNSGEGVSEKLYRQPYSNSGGGHNRKKNDYNSQEFYCKTIKPAVQPLKKESLQVASIVDEIMSANFSWMKNISIN
jgi:hypothetical protein